MGAFGFSGKKNSSEGTGAAVSRAVVNCSGARGFFSSANFGWDYYECIQKILRDGGKIHALMKADPAEFYVLIQSGGPLKGYFDSTVRNRAAQVHIVETGALTEGIVLNWCDTGDAEADERYIWLTNRYGFTDCMRLVRAPYDRRMSVHYSISDNDRIKRHSLYACVVTETRRHDLIHDPWHPVYPDLSGVVLRDLQLSPDLIEQKILFYSEGERRDIAGKFFSGGNILSDRGTVLSETEREEAVNRMLAFGQRWRHGNTGYGDAHGMTDCKAGRFYCCYYSRELPCCDGGNYGTDTESESISFRLHNEDPGDWDALLQKLKQKYPNRERQDVLDRWRGAWGYNGRLSDDTVDIAASYGNELYLRNPFGLRGIFCFCIGC